MNVPIRFSADPVAVIEATAKPWRSSLLNRAMRAGVALLSIFAFAGIVAADTPAAASYAGGNGTVILSGAGSIGGLVGDNQAAANANNYWNASTAGLVGVGTGNATGVTGLSSVQMKLLASFVGFNFTSPWRIDEAVSEPYFFFAGTLDIDRSITQTKYDALTDGVLVVRYLFGLTGDALVSGFSHTRLARQRGRPPDSPPSDAAAWQSRPGRQPRRRTRAARRRRTSQNPHGSAPLRSPAHPSQPAGRNTPERRKLFL